MNAQPAEKMKKVNELGIFAIGLGVILAAVSAWLLFGVQPASGVDPPMLVKVTPFVISAILMVLGLLTIALKNSTIVIITTGFVVVGFLVDLAIGFNIIKAAIDIAIIFQILKGEKAALDEIKAAEGGSQST